MKAAAVVSLFLSLALTIRGAKQIDGDSESELRRGNVEGVAEQGG